MSEAKIFVHQNNETTELKTTSDDSVIIIDNPANSELSEPGSALAEVFVQRQRDNNKALFDTFDFETGHTHNETDSTRISYLDIVERPPPIFSHTLTISTENGSTTVTILSNDIEPITIENYQEKLGTVNAMVLVDDGEEYVIASGEVVEYLVQGKQESYTLQGDEVVITQQGSSTAIIQQGGYTGITQQGSSGNVTQQGGYTTVTPSGNTVSYAVASSFSYYSYAQPPISVSVKSPGFPSYGSATYYNPVSIAIFASASQVSDLCNFGGSTTLYNSGSGTTRYYAGSSTSNAYNSGSVYNGYNVGIVRADLYSFGDTVSVFQQGTAEFAFEEGERMFLTRRILLGGESTGLKDSGSYEPIVIDVVDNIEQLTELID